MSASAVNASPCPNPAFTAIVLVGTAGCFLDHRGEDLVSRLLLYEISARLGCAPSRFPSALNSGREWPGSASTLPPAAGPSPVRMMPKLGSSWRCAQPRHDGQPVLDRPHGRGAAARPASGTEFSKNPDSALLIGGREADFFSVASVSAHGMPPVIGFDRLAISVGGACQLRIVF